MANENKRTITLEELELLVTLLYADLVQKEAGKGLSANDFTAALKTKLENIASGAQANVIEQIKLAGTAVTPDANKAVNIPNFGGANASAAGSPGLVPGPAKGNQGKFLKADGSWGTPDDTTYDIVTETVAGLMSAAMLIKLNGIAEGATANQGTITGITMNGASKGTGGVIDLGTVLTEHQDISGKANLASPTFTGTPKVPTAAAGTNTTQAASTAFVAAAITAALSGITGVSFVFVSTLPATGAPGTFYFVPASDGSGTNNFIEYVWNSSSNKFEEVGRPEVDLSGYMRASDYPLITEAEIRQIVSDAKSA